MFRGLSFLGRTPAAWPRAIAPLLLFLLLLSLCIGGAVGWLRPALVAWFDSGAPKTSGAVDWRTFGAETLSWLVTLLAVVGGALLAFLITPPLVSPALESIVELRERALGVPPRRARGFWYELRCGLRAQMFGLAVFGPLALASWLGGLVFPAAAPFFALLSLLCSASAMAWNLLDYPLTLRGVDARARFRFVRRHAATCLGFGLACTLVFWVPCFGIVLLPAGVAAATEVVWRLASQDADAPFELHQDEP